MQLIGYIKALTWIHPLHAIREFHLARAVVVVYPNRVGIRLGQCACGVKVVPSPSRICDDRMCRREIPGGRCHEYCSDTMHLSFSLPFSLPFSLLLLSRASPKTFQLRSITRVPSSRCSASTKTTCTVARVVEGLLRSVDMMMNETNVGVFSPTRICKVRYTSPVAYVRWGEGEQNSSRSSFSQKRLAKEAEGGGAAAAAE